MHYGDAPPSLEDVKDTLLWAVCHPMAGPPRRPQTIVLAWRMRKYYDALRKFGRDEIRVAITLESHATAVAISRAHGTDIEGVNHTRVDGGRGATCPDEWTAQSPVRVTTTMMMEQVRAMRPEDDA